MVGFLCRRIKGHAGEYYDRDKKLAGADAHGA